MKTSSLIITALGVAVSANALAEDTNWVDKQHQNVQNKLHHWSNGINDWLGETDPNKPAKASYVAWWTRSGINNTDFL